MKKKRKIETDPDGRAIIRHKSGKVTCQCWHCKHVYKAPPGTDCPKCGAA